MHTHQGLAFTWKLSHYHLDHYNGHYHQQQRQAEKKIVQFLNQPPNLSKSKRHKATYQDKTELTIILRSPETNAP